MARSLRHLGPGHARPIPRRIGHRPGGRTRNADGELAEAAASASDHSGELIGPNEVRAFGSLVVEVVRAEQKAAVIDLAGLEGRGENVKEVIAPHDGDCTRGKELIGLARLGTAEALEASGHQKEHP
jgi:hypothetical protein